MMAQLETVVNAMGLLALKWLILCYVNFTLQALQSDLQDPMPASEIDLLLLSLLLCHLG
jgi:putative effector of murein hydrolase LrgA (UPF0299 family)